MAVQKLFAFVEVDIQILSRVGVVHPLGNIEINSAHQVHQLDKCFQIDQRVAIDLNTEDGGKLLLERVDPLLPFSIASIDRIDLGNGVIAVNQRVTWNAHHGNGVIVGVQAGNDNGVGAGAVVVNANEQDIVEAFPDAAGTFKLELDLFSLVILIADGLRYDRIGRDRRLIFRVRRFGG